MCVPTLLTIHYHPPRRSPVAQPSSWKQLSPFFSTKLVNLPFKPIRFSIFRARMHTHSGSPPPPGLPLPSKLNWHSPHTPPGLVPPPSTPSKSNLHGKPCQNRHTFENFSKFFDFFDFLCTGPAPTTPAPPTQSARALAPPVHPSVHLRAPFCAPAHTLRTFCTLLHTFLRTFVHLFVHIRTPSCTLAHLCAPFAHLSCTSAHPCAPLRTLVHLSMHIHAPPCSLCTPSAHLPCTHVHFALHLPGLSPLSDFLFNLGPPSGYHGQPSPNATRHSAHFRTSV